MEDERFPDYASAVTGSPPTRGDRYEMLLNGDQSYPAMLDAIRTARRRVNFLSYIYSPGQAAELFEHVACACRSLGGAQRFKSLAPFGGFLRVRVNRCQVGG